MTITYDWIVDQMDSYPDHHGHKDVVFNIIWRCNATDGNYNVSSYGTCNIKFDNSNEFTPYSELTHDIVVGWVQNTLGEDQILQIKSDLADQIDKLANPTIVTLPNPWDIR